MASPVHKSSSQSLLQGTKGLWTQNDNSNSMFQPGIISQLQNTQSIIERLMQTREKPEVHNILDIHQLRTRQLLADTEERIFKEVIKLIDEVEDTKKNIITAWEENRKMEVEYPDAVQMAHFHGYAQKMTLQQCTDLEEENLQLSKQIAELEAQRVPNLEEVLKIERQKYEDLKAGLLSQSKSSPVQLKIPESRVNQLKLLISEHEQKRKESLHNNYPQLDRIKQQNEQLRLKTIQNLKHEQLQQQMGHQLVGMKDFLRNEEEHRQKFMEQLKVYKAEFRRIKNQNQILKEKLVVKEKIGSKENIKQNIDYQERPASKARVVQRPASKPRPNERPSSKARVQRPPSRPRLMERSSSKMRLVESYASKKNNVGGKLNEYESLIQRMQGRYF